MIGALGLRNWSRPLTLLAALGATILFSGCELKDTNTGLNLYDIGTQNECTSGVVAASVSTAPVSPNQCTGSATGNLAVTENGAATSTGNGGVALSGYGQACNGTVVVSVFGGTCGGVAISGTGFAGGADIGISGSGGATASQGLLALTGIGTACNATLAVSALSDTCGGIAISGTGAGGGASAGASGTGNATGSTLAVSGTGNSTSASGGTAVSGTGTASGGSTNVGGAVVVQAAQQVVADPCLLNPLSCMALPPANVPSVGVPDPSTCAWYNGTLIEGCVPVSLSAPSADTATSSGAVTNIWGTVALPGDEMASSASATHCYNYYATWKGDNAVFDAE